MTRANGMDLLRRTLPRWAVVAAAAVFLSVAGGLLYLFTAHEGNPPPLFFVIPFSFFIAFFPALWVLIVGHVNHDARRRGLNVWLWTIVATVTPNALGIIFYYVYVLARPHQVPCPACGAQTKSGAQFCARCGRRLRSGCPACGKSVDAGDAYCPSCGGPLGTLSARGQGATEGTEAQG